ncbi:manganese efflux pump [Carboxylicivirga mesophila]|uniref:Putative manganese efflux pump MntP n=1 Tax=Carboxylicivirga mesophila TaxID=1166478 RepID=A0ABS5KB55_9BACT|nr:manganese efflux pump MntP family protein [Carboxylicivirga mesophila]MBS2212171.1 manganese efflux pump [Carboxylicivirga mesophila]
MEILTLILLASALAMDSFAVSITAGISLKRFKASTMLRISLIFAFFQGVMPVIGWSLGLNFVEIISSYDHWVVFVLLGIIGGKMIYEALQHQEEAHSINIYSNRTICLLGIATSIDALAVGFSFSLLEVHIIYPALIIGVTTFIFSFGGLTIGLKLGSIFRSKIELIGGIILVGIGFKVLIEHVFA